MGEAKRRAAHNPSPFTLLTEPARSEKLGMDPFPAAFDFIYGMVEAVFTKAGGVNHELIGIDFENGKPTGVNVLLVNNVEDVPRLRARMLEQWAMVAHVFEAWAAPDASVPARAHPARYDIVAIMLNTSEFMAVANCRVDVAAKTIERAELMMPDDVQGRLGRSIGPRTMVS